MRSKNDVVGLRTRLELNHAKGARAWLELHFLDIMLHKGISVDKYLIGPSFRDRHLQSFVDHLQAEMPHVKDAFIACASHLSGNVSLQQVAQGQSIGYRRAAAAIASLRISSIRSENDLSMMLILGVAISTFTLHHSSCLPVCKYILGLVSSMYEKDYTLLERLGGDGMAFLLCLLGTEIEDCLLAQQFQQMRLQGHLSALIILHRLRHPYATKDEIPLEMAHCILEELDRIMELTGRAVPFADLPHLVACFELKDHTERRDALQKSQRLINFSQYCRTEQQASLLAFWSARDQTDRRDIYWTDVASCIG
ncbi:hypothetical protein MY4038_010244 [Beauveria bassiana]